MQRIDLIPIEHQVKIGSECGYLEPTVKEDSIFYADGDPIGFYITKLPEKLQNFIDIADREFRSKNVPKDMLKRASLIKKSRELGISQNDAIKLGCVAQYSTIIGSIPKNAFVKRNHTSISSVHAKKSAHNFIKSMLLAAKESEKVIKEILPIQYEKQKSLLEGVDKKWRFGDLFTSSISNYNIAAPYHIDSKNIKGTVNVIITKRYNSEGGSLHIPDYDAVIEQCNNSMLVYPAWRNVHGVTKIKTEDSFGYRNSLIFYALRDL